MGKFNTIGDYTHAKLMSLIGGGGGGSGGGNTEWTGAYDGTGAGVSGAQDKLILKHGTGTTVANKLYYLNTSSAWASTDADAVASGASQILGIAIGTSPTSNGMILRGILQIPSSLVNGTAQAGLPVYVSEDPSEYDFTAPTGAGDYIRVVGYCLAVDSGNILLYFNPDSVWVELT